MFGIQFAAYVSVATVIHALMLQDRLLAACVSVYYSVHYSFPSCSLLEDIAFIGSHDNDNFLSSTGALG